MSLQYLKIQVFFKSSLQLNIVEPTLLNLESFLCLSSTRDFGTPESGTGLHLTGGASLYGFIGLLVKHLVVNPESLPATFFCVGRQYKNLKSKREKYTIFDARQSTAVQIFDISKNEAEMSLQFEKWTSKMTEFYSKLNVKYRIGISKQQAINLKIS